MGFDNVPTLSGLFYIISTKDERCCGSIETVLSWNHFWGTNNLQQPSFTPFSYNSNNVFEYLEMFELNDSTFYSQCRNNNMDLKLWEKKENSFKELLNIPIKLHPYFDTFSNPKIASQFYKEKMPVVSLTDWIDVHVGSTVEPVLSAKIQVTLAIGTVEQLSTFRTSRNITVVPTTPSNKNDNPVPKKANPTALADMLSTFIDNLALSLPKRSESDQRQQYATDPRYQLRRTSDLLDVLHSALKNPAPVNLITSSTALPLKLSGGRVMHPPTSNYQETDEKGICVTVNIDSARNLASKENTQGGHSVDTGDINCQESSNDSTDETELPNNLIDLENGSYNVDNILLSRTLKRKFTELEEISQRLKSRLLDVTAATEEEDNDNNFDMEDEFENDLNTCPNEDDVDVNNDFDWNRFSTLEIDCDAQPPDTDNKTANAFNHHSALTISNIDSNHLPVDGNVHQRTE